MIKGEDDEEKSLDFALAWKQSSNCEAMALQAAQASKLPDEAKQITYSGKYAVKVSISVCNLVYYSATSDVRLTHFSYLFPYPNQTVV